MQTSFINTLTSPLTSNTSWCLISLLFLTSWWGGFAFSSSPPSSLLSPCIQHGKKASTVHLWRDRGDLCPPHHPLHSTFHQFEGVPFGEDIYDSGGGFESVRARDTSCVTVTVSVCARVCVCTPKSISCFLPLASLFSFGTVL